ncbi:MAG: aromatic amino acid ammonia-lyase [Pseudomonadota bacterium]
MSELWLTGSGLTAETLEHASMDGVLYLCEDGLSRMEKSRVLVDRAIAQGVAVYGVTTGLGARSGEILDADTLADFSRVTLNGRAQAMGAPLPNAAVRAAMIVRLNTFLLGHSGARPDVAQHLCAVLNAGLVPVVGGIGSIGASDLVLTATMGRALLGEGLMSGPNGVGSAAEVMAAGGIQPLMPAPRDGLALANHTGFSAGLAGLALARVSRLYCAAQAGAALTMEGFRANLSPMDAKVLAVKPLPGQQKAAQGLSALLEGSELWLDGTARRLQDPLSIRNAVHIHGGVASAIVQLRMVLDVELNGSSDNPVALADTGDLLSCGGYHTTELALAVDGVSRAWQHLAMAQLARIARMMEPDLTGLTMFLAQPESGSNGFAPLLKVAEDLAGEITQASQTAPVWPSINARGIEDALTGVMSGIRALDRVIDMGARLTALELVVAAQAVDLRTNVRLGAPMTKWHAYVRDFVQVLQEDRPMGAEIEALALDLLNMA